MMVRAGPYLCLKERALLRTPTPVFNLPPGEVFPDDLRMGQRPPPRPRHSRGPMPGIAAPKSTSPHPRRSPLVAGARP